MTSGAWMPTSFGGLLSHHDANAFADDTELHALLARHVLDPDDTVVVGGAGVPDAPDVLLPCVLRRPPRGACELRSLANYYLPDYRALCRSPEAVASIGIALDDALDGGGAQVARFEHLDPRAPETAALRDAFAHRGWCVRLQDGSVNWTEDVADGHAAWLARRPSRVRNTVRRRGAGFARLPGTRLEIGDGSVDIDRLVAAYEAVYARSWKGAEPYPGFMPDLIRSAAARGRLRLGIAWLDASPVAVQLWIVRRGVAFVYKLAHDEAGAKLSAGTLLFDAMAKRVIEHDGVTRLDFLSGDDAYKADWMGRREVKQVLHAWRPWTPRGLLGILRHDLGTLKAKASAALGRAKRAS